jgi:hypothetical protein
MVVNLADTAQEVTLQVAGETSSEAELWRLDQTSRPEAGSPFTFPTDGKLTLPAQSVSLFIIK